MKQFPLTLLTMLLCSTLLWAQTPKEERPKPRESAPAKRVAPAKREAAPTKPAAPAAKPVAPAKRVVAPAKRVVAPVKQVVGKPTSRPGMQGSVKTPGKSVKQGPSDGSHLSAMMKSGVVRVCVRTDIPPFGYFKGTTLQGFDVALAQQVVTALSIQFDKSLQTRWVIVRAGDRIKSLVDGRCDMAVSAFSITEERKKKVAFSSVYIQTSKVVLSRMLIDSKKKPVVAYVAGTTTDKTLFKDAQYVSFYTYHDILDTMKKGLVEHVVTDHPTGIYFVNNTENYDVSKVLKQREDYGIGVHKQHAKLLAAINKILSRFAKNGRLNHLKRTWIH